MEIVVMSLSDIAKRIGKDRRTLTKQVGTEVIEIKRKSKDIKGVPGEIKSVGYILKSELCDGVHNVGKTNIENKVYKIPVKSVQEVQKKSIDVQEVGKTHIKESDNITDFSQIKF